MSTQSSVLSETLRRDQQQRWARGERVLVESYLQQHPQLASNVQAVLELIDSEISLREQQGETAELAEYLNRFPELEASLTELLSRRGASPSAGTEREQGSAATRSLTCPFCTADLRGPLPHHSGACEHCGREIHVLAETISLRRNPGRSLGAFQLLRRIGRGKFGDVWLARDTRLSRDVAIKVPREVENDPAAAARTLREARAAAGLQHANIVRVFEVGEQEGMPYIVSEFIRGVDLKDLIDRKAINLRQSAELLRTIATALAHAHEAGIIHRDLKPANVLVDEAGQPYITDFGLAKALSNREATLTLDGDMVGTPAYMSPEQARGKAGTVGPLTDVYALGVVLYELIAHRRPFVGSLESVLHQIAAEEPAPPRKLNREIPVDLETICLKAMAKQPADRYASAQALADDLGRFLRDEPILARPPTPLERVWRRARKTSLPRLGLATGILLLAAALQFWLSGAKPDSSSNTEAKNSLLPNAIDPPDLSIFHTVAIKTDPTGAKVVCFPLDFATGRVDFDRRVEAVTPSPTQVQLNSGMHLVVAYTETDFHEVYRTVTSRPSLKFTGHAHERWEYDQEHDITIWPTIQLKAYQPAEESLTLCPGGSQFKVDLGPLPGATEFWTVPPFFLEATELTAAKHARFDTLNNFNRARDGKLPSSKFSWNDAVAYAESRGLRLPDFVECEWAATQGGQQKFPWGHEPPSAGNWNLAEPVNSTTKDIVNGPSAITGLYSRDLEWTATRAGRDPRLPGFRMIVRGGPLSLINAEATQQDDVYWGPVNQFTRHEALGVRCARSPRARLVKADFLSAEPATASPPAE